MTMNGDVAVVMVFFSCIRDIGDSPPSVQNSSIFGSRPYFPSVRIYLQAFGPTSPGMVSNAVPRLRRSARGTVALRKIQDGFVAFQGLDDVWHFSPGDDPDAQRLADWLQSDVGRT